MLSRSAILILIVAATLALPAIALPRAFRAPAPTPAAASLSQPESITQIVEIDDRFYTLEVTVTRVIGGAPMDHNIPTTTVSVRLSAHDDELPANLDAVGVRFEKLRGTNRFSFIPLYAIQTGDLVFEEDTQVYHGEYPDPSDVQYLRTVVRLEQGNRVIKVPMGIVRVNQLALP